MREEKRRALEAAGFRIGDAEDFLELTEEERRLVELQTAERPGKVAGIVQEKMVSDEHTGEPNRGDASPVAARIHKKSLEVRPFRPFSLDAHGGETG